MSDLISRSALLESIWGVSTSPLNEWDTMGVLNIVNEQPTVDAVEVVRCKDCESYNPGNRICKSEYLSGCTIPDGYCFNGVRKKV